MRRALVWSVGIGLAGTVLLIASAEVLSGHDADVANAMRVCSAAIVPTLVLGVLRGKASARHEWFRLTVDNVLGSGSRLLILGLLLWSDELTPMTAAITISSCTVLGLLAYVRRRKPEQNQARIHAPRGFLSYSLRTALGTVSGIALVYLDQVLMAPLASTYELGLYAVAVSIAQVALVFNSTVASVTFAKEVRSPSPLRITRASRVSTAITGLICIAIAGLSVPMLPLIFGRDFSPSIAPLLVLLLGVVIGNPGSIVAWGLVALGRPEIRSGNIAVAAVVNVILVLVLVPKYGAMGAAWATVAGSAVASTLALFFLSRLYKVPARAYVSISRRDFRSS
jgi:O-antigen/teichoic acid export membrane protein